MKRKKSRENRIAPNVERTLLQHDFFYNFDIQYQDKRCMSKNNKMSFYMKENPSFTPPEYLMEYLRKSSCPHTGAAMCDFDMCRNCCEGCSYHQYGYF